MTDSRKLPVIIVIIIIPRSGKNNSSYKHTHTLFPYVIIFYRSISLSCKREYTHTHTESHFGVGYRHGLFLDFLCYHYHGVTLLSPFFLFPISYPRLLRDGLFVVIYLVSLFSVSVSSRVNCMRWDAMR